MADRAKPYIIACSRGTARGGHPSRFVLGQIIQVWPEADAPQFTTTEREAYWLQSVELTTDELNALFVTTGEAGSEVTMLGRSKVTTDGLDAMTIATLARRVEYDNTSMTARPGKLRGIKGTIVALAAVADGSR